MLQDFLKNWQLRISATVPSATLLSAMQLFNSLSCSSHLLYSRLSWCICYLNNSSYIYRKIFFQLNFLDDSIPSCVFCPISRKLAQSPKLKFWMSQLELNVGWVSECSQILEMFRANPSVWHPLQEAKFPCSSWNDAEAKNIVLLDRSWNTTIFLAFLSGLFACSSRQLESWKANISTVSPCEWVFYMFFIMFICCGSNTNKHYPQSRRFKKRKRTLQ